MSVSENRAAAWDTTKKVISSIKLSPWRNGNPDMEDISHISHFRKCPSLGKSTNDEGWDEIILIS